ncbi:hypothetical protein FAZ15_03170 [Sphingobacterium olei]|uniref:8-oxo-dGTP diphosphatase n=1 Tax=Sphingobacterium olei TaxID=2571155 RepID=A0A4U0P752_9SPHI|nr:hypothetical protein [Sphingobacterium olei]TJZ63295.1 hypothetical protein FAZ15_03170 [Sphingobacterium olei]
MGPALNMVEYHYPEFVISLYPFECKLVGGELHLNEHAPAIWVDKTELLNYDWAAADLPIVHAMMQR